MFFNCDIYRLCNFTNFFSNHAISPIFLIHCVDLKTSPRWTNSYHARSQVFKKNPKDLKGHFGY